MSGNERVTNRELNEKLEDFRRESGDESESTRVTNREFNTKFDDFRREVKLWIALGLVGGQTAASIVTSFVTHMNTPAQAAALAHLAAHLF